MVLVTPVAQGECTVQRARQQGTRQALHAAPFASAPAAGCLLPHQLLSKTLKLRREEAISPDGALVEDAMS